MLSIITFSMFHFFIKVFQIGRKIAFIYENNSYFFYLQKISVVAKEAIEILMVMKHYFEVRAPESALPSNNIGTTFNCSSRPKGSLKMVPRAPQLAIWIFIVRK